MSSENVALIRDIYDAVGRRDAATPFALYADDIVWDLSGTARASLMSKPVYHGHEGVREAWRESVSVFGEVDLQVDELTAAGDRVLAAVRDQVVGRASGAPVEALHHAVWTVAEGKVTRLQVFDDRAAAEAAAGLRSA